MTTIQDFPSLSNYTRKITISRNTKVINITDFIYEWRSEDDASDYFDLRDGDGYYRLNYNIITYLLLNHQQLFLNYFTKEELLAFIKNNSIFYHNNPKVKEYESYMQVNKLNIKSFIQGQFKNIQILSNSLAKLPPLNAVVDIPRYSKYGKTKEKLVLYRGFNYIRYKKMLQNIDIGKVITTTTFLSTSIQELIALKYSFNYNDDFNKHIVWKIIIDRDMFDIFNYTFISDTFNIQDDLETLFANSNIECEFLLNIGALLECVDMKVISYFPGYSIPGYNIPEKKKGYIEYTFKFIGWNYEYIERINSNMSRYIEYLK